MRLDVISPHISPHLPIARRLETTTPLAAQETRRHGRRAAGEGGGGAEVAARHHQPVGEGEDLVNVLECRRLLDLWDDEGALLLGSYGEIWGRYGGDLG